jgi:DNA-binding transcriptional regulator YhcF (GntR family)
VSEDARARYAHGVNVDELQLALDRRADVPVGVQLAWALRARIEEGGMHAGERLPGIREVAEATGLNVNTVRAVYQRLDQEGLIESRQGSGTFVADAASASADARAIAANAAREARATGIDPRAVAAALYVSRGEPPAETVAAGARRRELRSQIGALERAIGELESEHPGLAPPGPPAPRAPGAALLSVSDLEQVRASLVRRLAGVQSAIDARILGAVETAAPSAAPAKRSRSVRRVSRAASARGGSASDDAARAPAKPSRARRPRAVRPAAAET